MVPLVSANLLFPDYCLSVRNSSFGTRVHPQGAPNAYTERTLRHMALPAALMSLLSPTSLGLAPAWPGCWGLHLQAPIPAL